MQVRVLRIVGSDSPYDLPLTHIGPLRNRTINGGKMHVHEVHDPMPRVDHFQNERHGAS